MAHHGNDDAFRKRLAEDVALLGKLGATNQFPEGKLAPTDEGEIRLAIGAKDGKVCMDFGKSVHWIGFTPQQAMDMAQSLITQARACSTEPLTLAIGAALEGDK